MCDRFYGGGGAFLQSISEIQIVSEVSFLLWIFWFSYNTSDLPS